jgi:NTP pyrophosphatase (non-canonical NTP hydrolase)
MVQLTIDEILESLLKRGFYDPTEVEFSWKETAQTQVDAVLEELAEVARELRRDRQDVVLAKKLDLAREAADVVVAAVCLLGSIAGPMSASVIASKMLDDEKRGYKHRGIK